MKNVSDLFKEELNKGNRKYLKSCKITLNDGTALNITQADTWQNGFTIDESVSGRNTFDIGSANIDEFDRSKLVIYLTDKNSKMFKKRMVLFDAKTGEIKNANSCHYPSAFESDNKLYIIATVSYNWITRGAGLFVLDLNEI